MKKVEVVASSADRIRQIMTEKGYKQADLVRMTGIDKGSISLYCSGKYSPKGENLYKLSSVLGVSSAWLIGLNVPRIDDSVLDIVNVIDQDILEASEGNLLWAQKVQGARDVGLPTNIIPLPKTKKVPLLGTIACGEPILATENIEQYVEVGEHIHADFALECKGDSMINSRIFNGDIVYIRQQSDVDNGQIAAVLIGEEATLKKVYKYPNRIVLRAANPLYDDLIYANEQLNDIKILGKAVGFYSVIK